MERAPRQPDGNESAPTADPLLDHDAPLSEEPQSQDAYLIGQGIEAAVADDRPIDNRTARYIAAQLHGGQASALYALASSGAITDRVMGELVDERAIQPPAVQSWIDALINYCAQRADHHPIPDWAGQAQSQTAAELQARFGGPPAFGRPQSGASSITSAEQRTDEPDSFSWSDAARWSPADDTEQSIHDPPRLSNEQLEALFGNEADEDIGEARDLGWYGLIRWPNQPGGVILRRDENGLRHSQMFSSDDSLTARWAEITNEYDIFYAQQDAYETARTEPEHTAGGPTSRIWVGSLADYNSGHLHGEWFNATCDAEQLRLATQFMLRGSRTRGAEEWAVMDYDGFGPLRLSEYVSFETISRIASGIAEHGEAFAAWAAHVGPDEPDALDRFEDHYRGEWESFEAYVQDYLQEMDFYRFLDHVPEDMRGYVEVDVEQIARDWSGDYEVAERLEGGVWVFELGQ